MTVGKIFVRAELEFLNICMTFITFIVNIVSLSKEDFFLNSVSMFCFCKVDRRIVVLILRLEE